MTINEREGRGGRGNLASAWRTFGGIIQNGDKSKKRKVPPTLTKQNFRSAENPTLTFRFAKNRCYLELLLGTGGGIPHSSTKSRDKEKQEGTGNKEKGTGNGGIPLTCSARNVSLPEHFLPGMDVDGLGKSQNSWDNRTFLIACNRYIELL